MKRRYPENWLLVALLLPAAAMAEEYQPAYLDVDDPIHVDYDDSLDYAYSQPGRLSLDGDLRGGYFYADVDERDGSTDSSGDSTLRLRFGANYSFSDLWRLRGRLAATCSDDDCSPSFETGTTPSAGTNIEDGDLVVDEFYLARAGRQWDMALGRLQTRSLARGGVFATAMTRLTSANVSVNWTDGALFRYRSTGGWTSKLIAQYNDDSGSSTLARPPLNFEDDDTRLSAFYSLETLNPWGPIVQRGIDINYMPEALLTEGDPDGERDDYWNIVGRASAAWPLAGGSSLNVAGQVGFAPETPDESAVGLGGNGSADGWAWHLDASWMNFLPRHGVGVSYGVADAGWLQSISFRPNEESLTLRYHWRPVPGAQLEIQGRWREDKDALAGSLQKRDTFDYRVRLTWAFDR